MFEIMAQATQKAEGIFNKFVLHYEVETFQGFLNSNEGK